MLIMSSETVEEVKNEEATETVENEVIETTNEQQPTEQIKQEEAIAPPVEQTKEDNETQPIAKAKAKAKARTVKVVELVECQACNKKMLPKSLRNTHPHYCKGQPTETLPVNRQKASYGSKVEQKLRKEIEEEMKKKYEAKNEVVQYSEHEVSRSSRASGEASCSSATLHEPIEIKTKAKPVRMEEAPPPPKQLTARELLEASYNEIRKAKREEHIQKINSFKSNIF